MPGGRMPGGAIPGGNMPGGGAMPGGNMPGGAPGGGGPPYPGGAPGIPRPIIIGGMPGMPIPGGGGIIPRPMLGAIALPEAPMPAAGPRKPAGALMVALGMARPAARPAPGPAAEGATLRDSSEDGGDSTWIETTASPRSKTRPRERFSSRSSLAFPFTPKRRNSSQSQSTMFMCLSKAMNFPTSIRPSSTVTRMR